MSFPMNWNLPEYRKRLEESVAYLREQWGEAPGWAVVFGSGLGRAFADKNPPDQKVSYEAVPHFHQPEVEGHPGIFSLWEAKKTFPAKGVALQGRLHYYQGLSAAEVVFPVRALARWGIRRFILTNASGSIHPRFKPGSLALIADHLNLTGHNPLRGPNSDFLGPRFPSLNGLYLNPFSKGCIKQAQRLKLGLLKAVYVGISGPSYETPAEVAAFRKLGGHLVGMSTVDEAIALAQAGAELLALSAVTNRAGSGEDPDHRQVLRTAAKLDTRLGRLLAATLKHS
ncbi:MAG: purine-nucleoside phosphorylase [Candidatus Binatia bacterium]